MCTSHSTHCSSPEIVTSSPHCCPSSKVMTEKICGTFGPTQGATAIWFTNEANYSFGTFELYISPDSDTQTVTTLTITSPLNLSPLSTLPGSSVNRSVPRPTQATLNAGPGSSGRYCITLYKRVAP
ncbi:S-Ena type endospore appendage [Bacillus cereus]|uniref:S-Ena type endospore appendage n=1 Tax=Bacillus cereus TaxID=1396 RepID=UPI000BF48FC3|nr:S-Ena type endospore appendage [Bacillus cereus]PEQ68080.1 hypothetical protein CN469_04365 [Bacillus cereus]